MENKVFLESLPKWKTGKNKDKINWLESVGSTVECIYSEKFYKLEILDFNYKNELLSIKYENRIINIKTCNFKLCKLGKLFMIKTNEFKIKIGTRFGDLTITDRKCEKDEKGHNWKIYKYTCDKCEWTEGKIEESHLLRGGGCSCCDGRTAVLGINTVYDKRKDLIKYFKNEIDYMSNTLSSNKKVELYCPDCGREKLMMINTLSKRGFACMYCGDGVSFPEKFMIDILNQLNISFISQYTPKWSENKTYDFYIVENNTIIEMHGIQHYEEVACFKRSLAEEQANDLIKNKLAISNGIDNYIVINCSKTDLECMKNNIENSQLQNIIGLNKVSYEEAFNFANSKNSISIMIKEAWNNKNDNDTVNNIVKRLGFDKKTIIKYLKFWASLGQCNYDAENETRKNGHRNGKNKGKRVEVFKNGKKIGEFKSCREMSDYIFELTGVKLLTPNISAVINGKRKHYKGYTFKFI